MATEFLELKKLTIFVGEDFFCGDRPFYKVMLEKAAKLKLAGCTVFRGSKATEAVSAEGNGGFSSVFRRLSIFL